EFAFDVEELSAEAFAPPAYLRFIGLEVPRKFLERAFLDTYGFDIHEILGKARPALRSYRTSVRSFIPAFANAEVVLHKHQFPPHPDDEAYRIFAERVARTNYERRWKHTYKGPGFGAHLLAILVFVVPKIGAASDLAIKIPTHDTQERYLESVNQTVDTFRAMLHQAMTYSGASLALANVDLDTGDRVKRGSYPLTDKTYAHLLARLISKRDRILPRDLKENILEYYSDPPPVGDKMDQATWRKVAQRLDVLKHMKAVESPVPVDDRDLGAVLNDGNMATPVPRACCAAF
ncbi:MAG TPA: hypothetical protein VN281_20590, partial [Verrucomicrobiae bacterium]|nr:hypothetical protein [Verrucomicrobiae bacterium]